jgi:DNA-binding protein WhiA
MRLVDEAPVGLAVITRRPQTARMAMAALHASNIDAHVVHDQRARRSTYSVLAEFHAQHERDQDCDINLLRGAFVAGGSVSRPDRPPHLEILVSSVKSASALANTLASKSIPSDMTSRRGRDVVLVRTTRAVGEFLSLIGANNSRLIFEDGLVVRDLRASVTRSTNAEAANMRRAASAGVEQLAAIAALKERGSLGDLPQMLQEAAQLREANPSDTLEQLAVLASCSRSAMAGRLHRLVQAANE